MSGAAFLHLCGILVTRACLKLFDDVVPELLGSHTPSIPLLAQFIRVYGLWFLLIPAIWCVSAALKGQINGAGSITRFQLGIGILLTGGLFMLFTLSAVFAMRAAFGPF